MKGQLGSYGKHVRKDKAGYAWTSDHMYENLVEGIAKGEKYQGLHCKRCFEVRSIIRTYSRKSALLRHQRTCEWTPAKILTILKRKKVRLEKAGYAQVNEFSTNNHYENFKLE